MASKFNCPNCGAPNTYSGVGDTVTCAYCGQEIHPPEEMVARATVARFSSNAKTWIVMFIFVFFVIPMCLGFGGTLIGIFASILGAIAAFVAPFIGR